MVCFLAFNREASGSTGLGGREVGIGGGKGQGPALSPPQGKEGRENPGQGYHTQIPQRLALLGPGLTIESNRSPEQALCGARGHVHTVPPLLPPLLSGSTGLLSLPPGVEPRHLCTGVMGARLPHVLPLPSVVRESRAWRGSSRTWEVCHHLALFSTLCRTCIFNGLQRRQTPGRQCGERAGEADAGSASCPCLMCKSQQHSEPQSFVFKMESQCLVEGVYIGD